MKGEIWPAVLVLIIAVTAVSARPCIPDDPPGFLVDTSLVCVPLRGIHHSPASAFDGTNYLVAWEHNRRIHATRVSPDRAVLDLGSIVLDSGRAPAVAVTDSGYFIVWEHNDAIHGTRIDFSGERPDTVSFRISHGPGTEPTVSFNGVSLLVVWGGDDLAGVRVSTAGVVLDTADITISAASNVQEFPVVAFDGTNWLVVWQDMRAGGYYDVYGCRVSPAGGILDPTGIPISTAQYSQWYPVVGFDGANYLVAWQDYRTIDFDVMGARVTPGGAVLDPNGFDIAAAAVYHRFPAIAFDGTNYLVTWERLDQGYEGIYATRVTPDAAVLDTNGIEVCPNGTGTSAIVFDGTDYLVAWQDTTLHGTWLTPAGSIINPEPVPLAVDLSRQLYAAAAFNGTDYLVVWWDEYPYVSSDVCGVLLDSTGSPKTSRIDICPLTVMLAGLQVAAAGDTFLVVWQDKRGSSFDIYGARVDGSGVVLDTGGIAISTAGDDQTYPKVCFDGSNWLAVWSDHRGGRDVYGARVNRHGTVLDPDGIEISTSAILPSVSFDGTNHLVVWPAGRRIRGARVNPDGTVLDPQGIDISPLVYPAFYPDVLFNGTDFVVIWSPILERNSICGSRVNPQGQVLDSVWFTVIDSTLRRLPIACTFDGSDVVLAWLSGSYPDYTISGVRLDTTGTVHAQFDVLTDSSPLSRPHLCSGPENHALLVWEMETHSIAGRPCDTRRIWGMLPPFTAVSEPGPHESTRAAPLLAAPNPFRGQTHISYALTSQTPVLLNVYDRTGRRVRSLIRARQTPGRYAVKWDGRDDKGQRLGAGVYFCRLECSAGRAARTLTLMR